VGSGLQKEKALMKCVICKHGETSLGKATVTLERDGSTLVVQSVPAAICRNCGEVYVNEKTTASLLKIAEKQARAGVKVDVREYAAA
jgi:YgiT-type zinc finger domain-containing protein